MKISKLFHWLYAFLMFLPIVLFIPNALYYGFNEHASNTETTTINYKYQSNEVNSVDDLVEGNLYHYDNLTLDTSNDIYFNIKFIYIEKVNDSSYGFDSYDDFALAYYETTMWVTFNEDGIYVDLGNSAGYIDISLTQIYSEMVNVNLIFAEMPSNDFITEYGLPKYTDYNVIESVEINTDDTISNKMYQAWQSTWNLPLLQWTHTSFVAQPFTYITGLFGVPSDSTLNYIFAYFVSISICWLVFDLLMYVPNLAHRWLDKGALE